jgi:hypothetical protein
VSVKIAAAKPCSRFLDAARDEKKVAPAVKFNNVPQQRMMKEPARM